MFIKLVKWSFILGIFLGLCGVLAAAAVWWYLEPQLPSVESLKDVRLQVPLRIYTRDNQLLAEYGEKRRIPVQYKDIPRRLEQAVLAAEDDRFYEHPGVDWQGLVRAAWNLAKTGEKGQGGSTITMQVARNFFLSFEKTYLRKLNEIILSFKIEQELSKQEILSLYLNKIYLGQRAYGAGAASQVYYGRPLSELTLPEVAMIAGLPKAPSSYNPIANPSRALERRNYVLRRMHDLGHISAAELAAAREAPVTARIHAADIDVEAPYIGEMVRAEMVREYGSDAYTAGLKVYTSIDSRLQAQADRSLRKALLEYTERHGFFGPVQHLDLQQNATALQWDKALASVAGVKGMVTALVTSVGERSVTAYQAGSGEFEIPWNGLEWARKYISENRRGPKLKSAGEVLAPGDIIHARLDEQGEWRLAQAPRVEGALVSLYPGDGGIAALSGGYDFYRSKFNRVTQALRQPGSNFKPFIYSAALESGFTAASIINDAPVVFDDAGLESAWRPENYSGKFYGPTRLRLALIKSRNLVSIRLLRSIGIRKALAYIKRFGFDTDKFPRDLSLALGSVAMNPLQVATGYAVFANGGFRVEPYLIERVEDARGEIQRQHHPLIACDDCEPVLAVESTEPAGQADPVPTSQLAPRVLSREIRWLMVSMMRDVVKAGTARRAMKLGRNDLAGKTGTTNDQQDAWFSGFNYHLVTTTWVGFDQIAPLGSRETGGRAALPMWMSYMAAALDGVEERPLRLPEGLVTVRIDPDTGERVGADYPDAIFETFRVDHLPEEEDRPNNQVLIPGNEVNEPVSEQLF